MGVQSSSANRTHPPGKTNLHHTHPTPPAAAALTRAKYGSLGREGHYVHPSTLQATPTTNCKTKSEQIVLNIPLNDSYPTPGALIVALCNPSRFAWGRYLLPPAPPPPPPTTSGPTRTMRGGRGPTTLADSTRFGTAPKGSPIPPSSRSTVTGTTLSAGCTTKVTTLGVC